LNNPDLSFSELIVHQSLGDSDTMKVSNVETESSVAAITFTASDNLNLITIAT
jgi:hypothetical protein